MRTLIRFTLLGLAAATLAAAAGCDEYLGNINEGLNIHNMSGKVLIPKTLAPTQQDVGVVYVGIYSGTDTNAGYLSPTLAPDTGDAYPYGGTSVGDFMTRDVREVCSVARDMNVVDAGANWEVDFDILQFPFYPGATVWAYADQLSTSTAAAPTFSSCNPDGGFYGVVSINVVPADVTPVGSSTTNWTMTLEPTDIRMFDNVKPPATQPIRELIDAEQRTYRVMSVDTTGSGSLLLTDHFHYGRTPAITGFWEPQLQYPTQNSAYGAQYNDILNKPQQHIDPGDLVPSSPTIMNDLSPVTITLDSKVN